MKYIACLLAFVLIGFKVFMPHDPIPQSEQAVNKLLGQIAHKLEKKYKMHTSGVAISMPGGVVKELGLNFQIQGPLSKDEIRTILIESAQDFLSFINNDKDIQPHLEHTPFKIQNVEITLFIIDSTGRGIDDPYIGIAGIRKGKLDYWILFTTDIPNIKSEEIESYEEALKALSD